MLYLSGCKTRNIYPELEAGFIGLMNSPIKFHPLHDVAVWAMDNGAFVNKYPGDDAYLAILDKAMEHQHKCLFVTAPDVIGDGAATLALFPGISDRIRERGWPVAIVGQDGMLPEQIPWAKVDWLFLGGSTEWKLSRDAEALIAAAKEHGKKVHIGRVNGKRRYIRFKQLECDSADGTYLGFGPDINKGLMMQWFDAPVQQLLF